MSLTFGNFLFLFIGISLLILSVLLAIYSILKKRYVFYLVLAFALGCIFFSIISIIQHQIVNNGLSKDIPGIYKVNINKSNLSPFMDTLNIDTLKYNKLTIMYTPFKRFKFNMDVPFITGISGKWSYFFDGEISKSEMKFENGSKAHFDHNGKMISIEYLMPKDGYKQVNLLYFDKVNLNKDADNLTNIEGKKGQKRKPIYSFGY